MSKPLFCDDHKAIIAKYGKPSKDNPDYLVSFPAPYPLYYDNKLVKSIRCHKLIKEPLEAAMTEVATVYTEAQRKDLGLDQWGGCYAYRLMRGGTKLSTHSWGIAVDFDQARNQLKWDHTKARLAKDDCKPFFDIFYKHGFVSLGRERNYDWMHLQINL